MPKTYKIGEAAELLHLKTYVLRFWETEFPQIAPLRTEKGQRLYTAESLALLARIKFLLHERGLTIEGARKRLAEDAAKGIPLPPFPPEAGEERSEETSFPLLSLSFGNAAPQQAPSAPAAHPLPADTEKNSPLSEDELHFLAEEAESLYGLLPEECPPGEAQERLQAQAFKAANILAFVVPELRAVAELLREPADRTNK